MSGPGNPIAMKPELINTCLLHYIEFLCNKPGWGGSGECVAAAPAHRNVTVKQKHSENIYLQLA